MKYLVKTVKVNGEEKIDARRDSANKKKAVYCVKSEKGQVFTVDKEWLKAHKEELVNVGISGDSLYLKAYKKGIKTENNNTVKKETCSTVKINNNILNKKGTLTDKECQEMMKSFGGKIIKLNLFLDNFCYLSSKSETEHLLYIPSNIAEVNYARYDRRPFTPLIQKLNGRLKVIGGSNLKLCTYMFENCDKLKSIDLSNFDTSHVEEMEGMFQGCNHLEFLDLSNLDTRKVTTMENMFAACEKLQSLDLSGFDTRQVENMSGMFNGCHSLKSINVSSFNTSKVENMSYMFYACWELKSLDLRSFNISQVEDMSRIFTNNKKLSYILGDSELQ